MPNTRTIVWSANTCRHAETDVYLGLAPGIEDFALRQRLGDRVLVPYQSREIRLTNHNGNHDTVPLRMYALRDPGVCRVAPDEGRPMIPGFERVKLVFDPTAAANHPNGANGIIAPSEAAQSSNAPPVIAFLITIGLGPVSEKHFFNGVVSAFLDQSWGQLPELLREVGCEHP